MSWSTYGKRASSTLRLNNTDAGQSSVKRKVVDPNSIPSNIDAISNATLVRFMQSNTGFLDVTPETLNLYNEKFYLDQDDVDPVAVIEDFLTGQGSEDAILSSLNHVTIAIPTENKGKMLRADIGYIEIPTSEGRTKGYALSVDAGHECRAEMMACIVGENEKSYIQFKEPCTEEGLRYTIALFRVFATHGRDTKLGKGTTLKSEGLGSW